MSLDVEATIPAKKNVQRIFLDELDLTTARDRLLAGFNGGVSLVNYAGHGSVDRWRGDLLTSEDVDGLANDFRLPLVITMDCLNGLFHDPRVESLAAALLNATHRGAVAVWASSGFTTPDGQAVMNRALVPLLFQGLTVGEAAIRAKQTVTDKDVRRTWILFGDPAMKLKN